MHAFSLGRLITHSLPTTAFALAAVLHLATAAEPFAWSVTTPEEQGVDSEPLARLLMQVRRDGIDLDSFMLVRHDQIVAEVYLYPDTATTRHVLYSASKSFTSALVGIAIEEGLFHGVDDRVVDIFSGVTSARPSSNLSQMTLRHLLTMSTGHATDTTNRIVTTSNWEKAFLDLPVENPPGAPFVYNSGATFMLSAAIQRRAGMNAATYGRTRLFEPLGITDWAWDVAPGNITTGGWGLYLCSRDMAKFGLLYLHGGVWEERQIVPAAWVAASGRSQVDTGSPGTFWGSGYGYQFWINDFGGYRADGARGQYIFILPEYDAVAVFTSNLAANGIPGDLVRTHVVSALRSREPLPANPKANALVASLKVVLASGLSGIPAAPLFTGVPEDQVVAPVSTVQFSVAVSGSPAPAIQWYRDGIALPEATGATLVIRGAASQDAGEYTAVAYNAQGRIVSPPASLVVATPPEIRRQPVPLTVCAGDAAVFSIEAVGGDLSYTWSHNGAVLPGATTSTLQVPAVTAVDAGRYEVAISNARGTSTSAPVQLTVAAPEARSRLVNLSIRGMAGEEDETLIVGLVVAGADGTCGVPVLVRGVGATLAHYGVDDCLRDPALIVHAGAIPVAVNGDWSGDALISTAGTRLGAFGLPRASDDAAVFAVLPPRTYTMHLVSSLPSGRGIALAECYDAAGGAAVGGARLVNVSARASTAQGDGTLIAGFVVDGPVPLQVLVRGVGPGLAGYGVNGWVPDPVVRVYRGREVIADNDNWGATSALREAFSRTGAFALADDAKDAAVLVTLPPGVYTAHVIDAEGGSGVALIEVYEIPDGG